MESDISECALNKFLRRNQEHMIMFGYVSGIRKNMPSVSISKAINQFMDHFNIDGDVEVLRCTYNRMVDELMESEKSS